MQTIIDRNRFIIDQFIELSPALTAKDFDTEYWKQQKLTRILSGGRGDCLQICRDGEHYVLHPYLRGGAVAHLVKESYLWTGLNNSRPFREQLVVDRALQAGLPVPRMIGFRIERSGLFYRAVSLNEYIVNRGSLASCLYQSALEPALWKKLGSLIRRMHENGINHVDLNAHNILLNESDKCYIVDFDRARIEKSTSLGWRQCNLDRLLRSLNKIRLMRQQLLKEFYFQHGDWDCLVNAYESK